MNFVPGDFLGPFSFSRLFHVSHNALSRSWLGKVLSSAHFPACVPQECLKSYNLKCHQHTFSSWQWEIMDVIPLKRTTVKSTLLFPSGSRRVLEQTHRSWAAVKSLLCALFLDCFLSVRPAASAPEEFSVFFSKTEKNAARVPLQPPTRQTSPSQMLISVWTRGPVWHSPHTPLLQGNVGGHPLSPHHPLPATTTGCFSCRSDRAPKARSLLLAHFLVLQGCCFFTHARRFPVIRSHSHLGEFCQCTLCQSPCPPGGAQVLQVCLEHLVCSLVCLWDP